MAKNPYVTDPALQAEIDAYDTLASNIMASPAERAHLIPAFEMMVASEARMHWLGLQIMNLAGMMEYYSK
jgi:hypothetical protein